MDCAAGSTINEAKRDPTVNLAERVEQMRPDQTLELRDTWFGCHKSKAQRSSHLAERTAFLITWPKIFGMISSATRWSLARPAKAPRGEKASAGPRLREVGNGFKTHQPNFGSAEHQDIDLWKFGWINGCNGRDRPLC